MEKILITGTGRCGTTFLIKLFSFLEFDTGYHKTDYSQHISHNCNSGMERAYTEKHYILKNPFFMTEFETILNDPSVKIKTVIIPIRDFKSAAISRVKHYNKPGGLWNANNEHSQIQFYNHITANYIYIMTKYDINTIFIDFDRMVNDKNYLFNKLKCILDEKNIDIDTFCNAYNEVAITCSN